MHYSCSFFEETTQKLVIPNQKSYRGIGAVKKVNLKLKVVVSGKDRWKSVEECKICEEQQVLTRNQIFRQTMVCDDEDEAEVKTKRFSWFHLIVF